MPISEKIKNQVKSTKAKEEEKALMMEILQIEDKGSFRYQTDYEKVIKDYIAEYGEEDLS